MLKQFKNVYIRVVSNYSMKENSTHIPVIDLLRGIAAMSVCLFHFICTTTGYIQSPGILNVFSYGDKGVEVFFIISGIVIPLSMINGNYSYQSVFKFAAKRFMRIEPPYLAAVLVGIIYLTVRNYVPGSAPVDLTPSIRDVWLHIGYLVPFFKDATWINPPFWTLSVEFQYYLSLAVIFPLVLNKRLAVRIIFYSILFAGPLLVNSDAFFPHWSAFFCLGILYILNKTGRINGIEYSAIFALCCFVVYKHQGSLDLLIGLLTLLVVDLFGNFESRMGKFFGNISYSLYLLHSIIGTAFINFMSHRYTEAYQKFIVISAGVLISVASAYIFYRFIEKPSQRMARRIKY